VLFDNQLRTQTGLIKTKRGLKTMKKILLISITLLLLTARPALAMVVSTFDGTDLDGWTRNPSIGFTLTNPGSGGNPGGYAQLGDTSSGGSGLPGNPGGLAEAPLKFLGDLSGYVSISWDALLPGNWDELVRLVITNMNSTTKYIYTPYAAGGQTGVWQSWQAQLDGGPGWSRTLGSESFSQVLADVGSLAFDLEVSPGISIEAGLDNVKLNPIPVPAALWLFGSGLLGLLGVARRRQT
jgi:hypothetical protein